MGKFDLVICELHNPLIHGSTNPLGEYDVHFILYERFTPSLSYPSYVDEINDYIRIVTDPLPRRLRAKAKHPVIRNYHKMVQRRNYIQPEIAQCIVLPSEETVAILKTFWIRIIQRTWKKVFQKKRRMMHNVHFMYQRYLRVSSSCSSSLPGLRGMLKGM